MIWNDMENVVVMILIPLAWGFFADITCEVVHWEVGRRHDA